MTSSEHKASSPRIVLGVAGGIAAFKAVELLRRLRELGYFVSPILTPDATHFVGALTFSALASEPARTSLFNDPSTPIPHTYLGQNADLIVVAPATAHLIARYAAGLANDLLGATLLASRAPVLLCPAMHSEMWEQPSVQENLATLRRRGVMILNPDVGLLAGGDVGAGRLAEPETISNLVSALLAETAHGPLANKRVLISAGGTREPIDPVRVITNRSSGRQGFALAEVAARLGATVTLVSCATLALALDVQRRVEVIYVDTAAQMATEILTRTAQSDVVIMAAAVADFTARAATNKLKKEDGPPALELEPTQDILVELGKRRHEGQIIVGFAAETDNALERATQKMKRKNCDLMVLNDVSADGAGFDHPTNEVVIIERSGQTHSVSLRSKEEVSYEILTNVAALLTRGAS